MRSSPGILSFLPLLTLAATLPADVAAAADYIIHISADGLGSSYLQAAITAGSAPNFKRFLDEGAATFNARTDFTETYTLPNHTTMLTGRPVAQPEGMPDTVHHGYTDNGDPDPSWTLHNQGNPNVAYKASTFDVAHDAGYSTALYASKSKFMIYDQSYDATNGAENSHGRDKIDNYFFASDFEPPYAATMQTQLLADLAAGPARYCFVHYADLDYAGHGYGWGSDDYKAAITTVDGYLGGVFTAVNSNSALTGKTAIILSADHGGLDYDHGDPTLVEDYTIPFLVWGAGVAHGDLYAFNSETRSNPGASRPTYTQPGQPIRNGDGGNLALDLLGLGPIPGSFINAAQNLRVAMPGDFNLDNRVDSADYATWRKGLGTTYIADDYLIWRTHFGEMASGGSLAQPESPAANVPEPAACLLVCSVLLGEAVCRRRGPLV